MLESFKEVFTSTASTAVQRVKNPALGAFAMSWCAFNWKAILFLFLSDADVTEKITYISSNSTWKTVIGYPCISVILICGFLPWVNNLISMWQAKPLDNNDSIENHRKAKQIQRATRLQRLQAKHDVTYEKVKTGAEKDIQSMKEQITESQVRMGTLTDERDRAISLFEEEKTKVQALEKTIKNQKNLFAIQESKISDLSKQVNELGLSKLEGKSIYDMSNSTHSALAGLSGLKSAHESIKAFTGEYAITPNAELSNNIKK